MIARLRQLVTAVRKALHGFGWGGVSNLAAVAGAGLVARGAWAIYAPAGLIVAGLFLLAFAWLVSQAAD